MDLKTLGAEIAKIGLPLLGAALPIPGGMALGAALASQIGAPSDDPSDILATLTGNAQALAQAKQFELTHQETMLKLTLDSQTALFQSEVSDRQDARAKLGGKDALWWVAGAVLLTFAIVMITVLYGSWTLLSGGITIKDVSVVAAVSGLVGSIVGYVAANAQTVINFLFGGSMGNEKNSAALADSVRTSTQALAVGNNTPWTAAAVAPAPVTMPVSVLAPVVSTFEQDYAPSPGAQGEIYKGS